MTTNASTDSPAGRTASRPITTIGEPQGPPLSRRWRRPAGSSGALATGVLFVSSISSCRTSGDIGSGVDCAGSGIAGATAGAAGSATSCAGAERSRSAPNHANPMATAVKIAGYRQRAPLRVGAAGDDLFSSDIINNLRTMCRSKADPGGSDSEAQGVAQAGNGKAEDDEPGAQRFGDHYNCPPKNGD
jgi:hypothetical protein